MHVAQNVRMIFGENTDMWEGITNYSWQSLFFFGFQWWHVSTHDARYYTAFCWEEPVLQFECSQVPVHQKRLQVAKFILFIDKLFDTFNSSNISKEKKDFRQALTKTSPIHQFWIDARRKLDSTKFVNSRGRTPTLQNWSDTIQNMCYLTNKLFEAGLQFICTRNFN